MSIERFKGALLSALVILSIIALAIPLLSLSTAHAEAALTEIRAVIYPTADVYAFGESGVGYSRTQLKFDISGIPLHGRILLAKLWLCRFAADGWDGDVTLNRVDNQLWDENIIASQFDAQVLTNEETYAGKFTSYGWGYLDATDQLNADYEAGNTYASFRLGWANDNGSEPSIGIDDGKFLVIDGSSFSLFLYSSEYSGSAPYLEIVYVPPYAVSASISPSYENGANNATLTYTVTVNNTGSVSDNYSLTDNDNAGWFPSLSKTSIVVAPGTSDNTTTLSVTIPSNAMGGTIDNITIKAAGTGDNASTSCTAQVNISRSVSVSIWPPTQSGANGAMLTYTVTIANTGNVPDTYNLENTDNAGWATKSLSTTSVGPLAPFGSSDNATLNVTIPSGAIGGTIDNIKVTATGTGVSGSGNCTAAVTIIMTGTASLRLAGGSGTSPPFLYGIKKVNVTANLVINNGDNLRLVFLALDNSTIEGEAVIWSRTAPGVQTVTLSNLIVPHPDNVYVKRVKLVLTDNSGAIILDNMAWYKVVQDDWGDRINWIVINWALHSPSDQDKLGDEVSTIVLNWALVPSGPRDQHDFP